MALIQSQPNEKEKVALVIMGVIAVLCVGFGVISNASKQKEVGRRVELEAKLDQFAQENGKLQKELNQAKARLDEEVHLTQTLNASLAKEQESAQALRSELEKLNQARRDLERQIQQLQSSNQTLERQIQAKAMNVIGQ
ncbi:MAG: hypothetical protein HYS56_04560 [Candidatus Omnitrophica bacterium]|nr:hypothetical protein [Candidatus Omnitrophota bacterium]